MAVRKPVSETEIWPCSIQVFVYLKFSKLRISLKRPSFSRDQFWRKGAAFFLTKLRKSDHSEILFILNCLADKKKKKISFPFPPVLTFILRCWKPSSLCLMIASLLWKISRSAEGEAGGLGGRASRSPGFLSHLSLTFRNLFPLLYLTFTSWEG